MISIFSNGQDNFSLQVLVFTVASSCVKYMKISHPWTYYVLSEISLAASKCCSNHFTWIGLGQSGPPALCSEDPRSKV